MFWPGYDAAAIALAEIADRTTRWPGIDRPSQYPIRLVLTPNDAVFDSVTLGRLPSWRAGVAIPATNTIVLVARADARSVLRHELAHLALRNAVRRVPLWFDEGYASYAAGEWGRLEALRVNWALARGAVPSLRDLDRDLRSGAARAEAGYALATTAILTLDRLGGDRQLGPLIEVLGSEPDLDAALRQTYAITLDQFEGLWRKDLRRRYGWILFITSFSIFWSIVAGLTLVLWARRRRRDRVRRAALDIGWHVEEDGPAAS